MHLEWKVSQIQISKHQETPLPKININWYIFISADESLSDENCVFLFSMIKNLAYHLENSYHQPQYARQNNALQVLYGNSF